MLTGLVLPFLFDPVRLKADLALVRSDEWTPHYNEREYGGEWRGVALRSAGGGLRSLGALPPDSPVFADTPLLERCMYFREVVSCFQCPLKTVRLLSLAPQSFIREHTDDALDYEDGEIRIHVPVQTGPGVEFFSAGQQLLLAEGRAYYINVNLPHRVTNRSPFDRIHLVIDAKVNDWVHEIFRQSRPLDTTPSRPRNFDEFRADVLKDATLTAELSSIANRELLTNALLRLGRDRNFDFGLSDVEAAFASARRKAPAPQHIGSDLPRGWAPVRVTFRERRPVAEWVDLGAKSMVEPFFEDSVRLAVRVPFAQLFRREIPLQMPSGPWIAPSGFIFHMSRCGSTLISQMLAALPDAIVISEAPPVDQIIQAHLKISGLSHETQVTWLRAMVASLGRPRTGDETRFFVKFDAWHIHNLPLIRAAFPETPWIFVFRDPAEVMLSQLSSPGMHVLPGAMEDPRSLRLNAGDITSLTRGAWCERAIGNILESAVRSRAEPGGLFVNYAELPDALWGRISNHWEMPFNAGEIARMRERSRAHAKTGLPWTRGEDKAAAAYPLLTPFYAALDVLSK